MAMDTQAHPLSLKVMRISVRCHMMYNNLSIIDIWIEEAVSGTCMASILLQLSLLFRSFHRVYSVSAREDTSVRTPQDAPRPV